MAIAIPVFTAQLHKSQDTADLSNIRAYYADLQADYLLNGYYAATGYNGQFEADPETSGFVDEFTLSDGQEIELSNLRCKVSKVSGGGYDIAFKCKDAENCKGDFKSGGDAGYSFRATGGSTSGGSTGS